MEDTTTIDAIDDMGQMNDTLRTKRSSLAAEILSIASAEEALWKKRCKTHWLQEGDENTAFFHRYVTANTRKNHIGEILSATE